MIKLTAGVQVSPQMLDGAEGGGVSEVGSCSAKIHFFMELALSCLNREGSLPEPQDGSRPLP